MARHQAGQQNLEEGGDENNLMWPNTQTVLQMMFLTACAQHDQACTIIYHVQFINFVHIWSLFLTSLLGKGSLLYQVKTCLEEQLRNRYSVKEVQVPIENLPRDSKFVREVRRSCMRHTVMRMRKSTVTGTMYLSLRTLL